MNTFSIIISTQDTSLDMPRQVKPQKNKKYKKKIIIPTTANIVCG